MDLGAHEGHRSRGLEWLDGWMDRVRMAVWLYDEEMTKSRE